MYLQLQSYKAGVAELAQEWSQHLMLQILWLAKACLFM